MAISAFAGVYLRMAPIGDPFSGTWRLNFSDPYAVVIKLQRSGYFIAVANGQTSSGWVHATRRGGVLTATLGVPPNHEAKGVASSTTLVFQSWGGHLVETDHNLDLVLTKMSDGNALPG